MRGRAVEDETFCAGEVEHGAVGEIGGRGAAPGGRVGGGVPGVEVGVEVEDGEGLVVVDLGEGAEGTESDGVVTAEGEEFGSGPGIIGGGGVCV